MIKNYRIRRFRNSDSEGIIKLFRAAFRKRFSLEWWKWKYEANPAGFHGEKGDIWIAENGDGIVGHWAVMPEKMKVGANTEVVAQAVDAATHPEYRRRGIFKALVGKVCQDARKRYAFIFGHPNETIHKGYLKLGWKDFSLSEFYKFINYDRPLSTILTNKFLIILGKALIKTSNMRTLHSSYQLNRLKGKDVQIQEVTKFTTEMDRFWRKSRPQFDLVLERDATFLNWRFSKHFGNYQIFEARSSNDSDIVGFIVLRKTKTEKIENILDIVDLNVLPREKKCMLNLLQQAIKVAIEEKLAIVHCRLPKWHPNSKILQNIGFIHINPTLYLMKMFQPRLIIQTFPNGKTKTRRKWFYTLADTDDA